MSSSHNLCRIVKIHPSVDLKSPEVFLVIVVLVKPDVYGRLPYINTRPVPITEFQPRFNSRGNELRVHVCFMAQVLRRASSDFHKGEWGTSELSWN